MKAFVLRWSAITLTNCTKHTDIGDFILLENFVCIIYVHYGYLYQTLTVYSPLSQHIGHYFKKHDGKIEVYMSPIVLEKNTKILLNFIKLLQPNKSPMIF